MERKWTCSSINLSFLPSHPFLWERSQSPFQRQPRRCRPVQVAHVAWRILRFLRFLPQVSVCHEVPARHALAVFALCGGFCPMASTSKTGVALCHPERLTTASPLSLACPVGGVRISCPLPHSRKHPRTPAISRQAHRRGCACNLSVPFRAVQIVLQTCKRSSPLLTTYHCAPGIVPCAK
jgi:hypothetical protein